MSEVKESPRSQLVENAIKFLQDPQVRKSSLSKQLAFLESKGLTSAEIDEARRRADISDNVSHPLPSSGIIAGSPPPLPQAPPPRMVREAESGFSWGRFLLTLAVIGSAGAALSQSVVSEYLCRFYRSIKQRIVPPSLPSNEAHPNADIPKIQAMQEQLRQYIEQVRQQLHAEVEAVKTTQHYLYRELSNELEDLCEEFKIRVQPIATSQNHQEIKSMSLEMAAPPIHLALLGGSETSGNP